MAPGGKLVEPSAVSDCNVNEDIMMSANTESVLLL